MSKDLSRKLKINASPPIELTGAHIEETIMLAQRAYLGRRRMQHVSTFEMIVNQFRFIAPPVWLLQGAVLLCMSFLMRYAMASKQPTNSMLTLLSISSIFIAMTMLPFYGRSRKHKMREIESVTRVSLSRMILAKLCVIGIGDVICLSVVILITLGKIDAPTLLIYMAIPFLLTCAGSLSIMNRAKESYGIYISVGFGVGLSTIYWTLAMRTGDNLIRMSEGLAALVCVFLILILILECRRLLRQMPSPDLQNVLIF